MTEAVILFRNTMNGKVGFVSEEDMPDNILVLDDYSAALAAVSDVPILRAYPYQIVEIDELPDRPKR